MSTISLYPSNPVDVPSSVIETSASFKKEVSKVMGSIFLFFLVYIIMVILSIGLAIACVYGGVMLIVNFPRLYTLLIGIGIIGLGVMVFIFLIKFIFSVSKFDRSGSIEITKEDQPELFDFIRCLTKDTQTPFPQKIYLSADVNACVFYDSSFWSMFFPVRKNLQIGLGLVNSLNLSEFKAVMAHEFGHFSQRSMKLGSFVYNVNRVIYNMLYENKDYVNSLRSFARASSYFAFFAGITIEIVKGIQSVLKSMYGLINKNYMGLSREMEFHADAVAASVAGGNNFISSLKRAELGNVSYSITLQKCDEIFKEKLISKNIFLNQYVVMMRVAQEFEMKMNEGLPIVNEEYSHGQNFSRINFKDQWASHPAREEREIRLNELGIRTEPDIQLAWVIFRDKSVWQEKLTHKLYEKLSPDNVTIIDEKSFESKYNKDVNAFSFPKEYKNFYNRRRIEVLEKDEFECLKYSDDKFDAIFSVENESLPGRIDATEKDIQLLKDIKAKKIDVKTFDFDGKKYNIEEAPAIITDLEKELEEQNKALRQLDRRAISFFYHEALKRNSQEGEKLKSLYADYFAHCKKADDYLKFLNLMMGDLGSIYKGEAIPVSTIESIVANLKNNNEVKFKECLRKWEVAGVFKRDSSKRDVDLFINSKNVYFDGTGFKPDQLRALNELVNSSWQDVNEWLFFKFKNILQEQLTLLHRN